jgi:hypothetical protein
VIQFASRRAEKGWQDLLATTRNSVADAWDSLTRAPTDSTETNHRLKHDLATVSRDGEKHERWQHELPGGARIWFYVQGRTVWLIDVHTHHPNQTKT